MLGRKSSFILSFQQEFQRRLKMIIGREVWFFLIRTNTNYVRRSNSYSSFEEAYKALREVQDDCYEEPITPVMKGYEKA